MKASSEGWPGGSPPARGSAAGALLMTGRPADAIHLLRVAVTIAPQFAVALATLAVAQAEVADDDRWRRSIDRAKRQPNLSRRERQHIAVIAVAVYISKRRPVAIDDDTVATQPTS